MQFRDLEAQYRVLQSEIDHAVANVLSSGVFIGGDPVRKLEEDLASFVGTKYCITCANGTDALQLALMAWGVGPGDAVFVPDFTFFASGEVVRAAGATPVFVDVDPRSFNIDPDQLEKTVRAVETEGKLMPRAVVAVDLFGLPANYLRLRPICKTHGLLLLEDGAQGFGGSIGEMRACSFGDISTTSFFPAKPLGCYGDGGAVFTNSGEWAELVRSYAVHGKGNSKYDNVRIGLNSRLDTIQAAILSVKLTAFLGYELASVNHIADFYDNSLSCLDLALPKRYAGFTSSWAQYTIQLPENINRDAMQTALKNAAIPTAVYYPKPMHEQIAFSGAHEALDCHTTERLCRTVLSLPMGPYLTESNIHAIAKSVRDAIDSQKCTF